MRQLLQELGYKLKDASTLYTDDRSAITVSENPEHFGRMKHMDLRHYWLRDQVERLVIKPDPIPTAEQVADMLTKCVPVPKVRFCREQMGVLP